MAQTKKTTKTEEKVVLNPKIWELPLNEDLITQVIFVMRSNARKSFAHAKTRAMVSGGGKKPWKQKGTGRARAGSIRSPLWTKGGVTFVPNERNWSRNINKKMRKLAVLMLLSEGLRKESLEFVKVAKKEKISDARKTISKEFLVGKNNLVITESEQLEKALRNVPKVVVVSPKEINALNLILAKKILIDQKAVNVIEENFLNEK